MTRALRKLIAPLCVACALVSAALGQGLPKYGATCVPEPSTGNRCTANDLAIEVISVDPARAHCDLGETFDLDVLVSLGSGKLRSAAERYNVGVWVGEDGAPSIGGNQCTFSALQPLAPNESGLNLTSGSGPYREINGDICGDILDSEITYHEFTAKNVLCRDTNGNGKLDISITVAWLRNKNDSQCSSTDPSDETGYYPLQSSACREEDNYDIDVIVVEPPPEIEVYKTAIPDFVRSPSGTVSFEVEVFNESDRTDKLTITSLTDDQFGDLAGQGNCALGAELAAGESYRCEFQKVLEGNPGETHQNTVTATAADEAGLEATDTDSAIVTFLDAEEPLRPDIRVIKAASPHSISEPGGPVLYRVEVWNDGETDLTLTSLQDSLTEGDGSLDQIGNCKLPQDIGLGLSYECGYVLPISGRYPGSVSNIVTATAEDPVSGLTVTDTDEAEVNFRDAPIALSMRKLASPRVITERSLVTYTVIVTNQSKAESVTLESLVDNYHGDLLSLGLDCGDGPLTGPISLELPPDGSTITCTFSAWVPEGNGSIPTVPTDYPDTVTASGSADDGSLVSVSATAEVELIPDTGGAPTLPQIAVIKNAFPNQVPITGGAVEFSAAIHNQSANESVLIESVIDNVHGNLNNRGTCGPITENNPREIAAGESFKCEFVETLTGTEGFIERDTITASGQGMTSGEAVTGFDRAAVRFTGVPLDVTVSKTPSRNLIDPGETVEFTIDIDNQNDFSVEIYAIVDSVFGNLEGTGNCAVPLVITPRTSSTCSFAKATFPNVRPRLHYNELSIYAQPEGVQRTSNAAPITASDQAWIAFTRALSEIALPVPVLPNGLLIALCALGVWWLGRRRF